VLSVPAAATAQQRAGSREQLARLERLDDVVVGAEEEAGDPVQRLDARTGERCSSVRRSWR
jgi:hypothetical protein